MDQAEFIAAQEAVEEAALDRSGRLVRVVLGVLELLELGLVEHSLLDTHITLDRGLLLAGTEGFASRLGSN